MKFSEQWLRSWCNPAVDTKGLSDQLTMLGLEVNSVVPVATNFKGVFVGKVLSTKPHPDSERLCCCKVDVGLEPALDIVCGAVNVRADLRVPVAIVGAVLRKDLKIKKAKVHGILSEGMICSTEELGLGESIRHSVMELREDAPIGSDFRKYLFLEDSMIDIELTPNRGDCLSIRGIARDLSVINPLPTTFLEVHPQASKTETTIPVIVEAPEACPRYVGRVIQGISSDSSTPIAIRERLRRSGFRTVHPVVDILNYVMLELGQPMHAFDLDQLNKKVIVRYARKKERVKLLNHQEYELHPRCLVISDARKVLAVAGVMGSLDSAVKRATKNIFIESAFFDPIRIRQSAKSHSLQTDSSYRFERGVDYNLQIEAIERVTALIVKYLGGDAGPVIEQYADVHMPSSHTITFRVSQVERLLGIPIEKVEIEKILFKLGMELNPVKSGWTVAVPSYRFDIKQEVDLIEEVARIYGYNRITPKVLRIDARIPELKESYRSYYRIANSLIDQGYFEAITYSFISPQWQSLIEPVQNNLTLSNPISNDLSVMRSSLWPGLLQAAQYNYNRQMTRIRLFEMGCSFTSSKKKIKQLPKLAAIAAGIAKPEQWSLERRSVTFYDMKGDVEMLLAQTGHPRDFSWRASEHPALHPGQTAALYLSDELVGYLGILHPKLKERLDLNLTVCCFEVFLSAIQEGSLPKFQAISKFPVLRRDLSVVVDRSLSAAELQGAIEEVLGHVLSKIDVFDVYQGHNVAKDKKSIALGLTFRDSSRTLMDTEINDLIQAVLENLKRNFNAKLRA